ncbi:hypothetical protein NDU88_005707 [Pleurodeles waltl]|uniref:Uncharacterized protein n=1 Tax=Pleurodeles waltl TaxID=8319 RepID=A0AAV7MA61_PLEWA|nr:hypothetical protein NDU88_005707 [Pleurodeles waltl]
MDSSRSRLPWCFALSTAPPAGHSRGRRGEHRCRRSPVSDAWRLEGSSKSKSRVFNKVWPEVKLQISDVKLKGFGGADINIMGFMYASLNLEGEPQKGKCTYQMMAQ